MKIRKVHNILGENYKTKILKQAHNDGETVGQCLLKEKEIHLYPVDDLYDKKHTLLHEIIHAAVHESGVDQTVHIQLIEVLCTVIPTSILKNYDIVEKK